jgi:microcystin degradation protein MlrC
VARQLAVIRLYVAADSFASAIADRAAFERCEWASGRAALEAQRGRDSELAAVLDLIEAKPDWRATVLRCASTDIAAPLDDELFAEFCNEVLAGLDAQRWDAVYLSLHGAAVTPRRVRPELSLIAAVRAVIGNAALGASFDLQGNLAPEAARYLTFASACRTHPAVDRRATAARVLDALSRTAEGRLRPVGAVAKAFTLVPPESLQTDGGPIDEIEQLARSLEAGPVLDVSVFGGLAQADAPDAGAAGLAYADGDEAAARQAAVAIAAAFNARRAAFWADADPALFRLAYRKVPADLRPVGPGA